MSRVRLGLAAAAALAALAMPAPASAQPLDFLLRAPEDGKPGAGAARMDNPRGLATDRQSGHVYVSDLSNFRIVEYTPWGAFVKAWGWGVADGSPELQVCGPAEPEPEPLEALCRQGIPGEGAGQFGRPAGLVVDSSGDVYVIDRPNHRVQKFSAAGEFLLMFGGNVNKTKEEEAAPQAQRNVCTAASGDVCQAGTVGTGEGEFGAWFQGSPATFITAGPMLGATDTIYVGDVGRVQTFAPDGSYLGDLPDPEGLLAGMTVQTLAIDPSDKIYAWRSGQQNVLKLDAATGALECTLEAKSPSGIAPDADGNVYLLVGTSKTFLSNEVIEFDSDCEPVIPAGSEFAAPPESGPGEGSTQISSKAIATNVSCPNGSEPGSLYVSNFNQHTASYLDAYGPPPDCFGPPPPAPPQIAEQYATSVDSDGAVVRAKINPKFWSDTRYHVQYGIGECAAGGCGSTQPAPPGSLLSSKVIDQRLTTSGVFLAGLQPETTYRYRFIAQSSGGGPAIGPERSFTTPPRRPPPKADCPNRAFRTGPGAFLADCRAYELVTPLEKGNGDVLPLSLRDGFSKGLEQSALDGNALAYTTYRSFGDSASAPYESEYLAARGAGGWSSHGLNPPREGDSFLAGGKFELAFKAFSPDLSTSWLEHSTEPVLAPGTPAGFTNLYRRDAGGAYEALIDSPPANLGEVEGVFEPQLQGVSADGRCAVFRANGKLTEGASSALLNGEGVYQVYLKCEGQPLRLVSALPSGTANASGSATGTANASVTYKADRSSSVLGAISADGQRVYWTAARKEPGALYLRERASRPQSNVSGAGKCTEPAKACTTLVSSEPAQFWQGALDGSKALYSVGALGAPGPGADLFEFDAESGASTPLLGRVRGLLGASEDLERLYAVSEEGLDGGEAGEPNLYFLDGGAPRFLGELAGPDAQASAPFLPSPVNLDPSQHLSRVSADGMHAAFMSSAPLTGQDNLDANTGESDAQVFLYDAELDQLICASCNASGARPVGGELLFEGGDSGVRAAARIPPFKTQLHAPRVLSEDGRRLFFESYDALVPGDSNGKLDVYEWQRAAGKPACEEAGAELYVAASSGCLSLISSGQSAEDSEFVDASPSGDDVFIRTGESLLPHDPGLIDIYDARVGGGFAPPEPAPPECEGAACQSPPPAPAFATPASSAFKGPGDLRPAARKRCGKGQRLVRRGARWRCVRKGAGRCRRGNRAPRRSKKKARCGRRRTGSRRGHRRRR